MTDAENTKPELPKNVRVRFCPSPTGTPHVGMIRTALFNWAEARATGGTLIFRIEDTDAVRDSEESYNQILESLRWLGIDWDEGIDVGGPHGPYRQSERTAIYKDVAAKLLEAGYAYESFSTPEEIKERNLAAGRPAEFGYDGYDRNLTDEQKAAFRAEGRKPALRIKMPDEDIAFDDLIRGTIEFKAGSVPDYVIVRPNGDPLYTLTNPVDDAMMEVNVVLRGEDRPRRSTPAPDRALPLPYGTRHRQGDAAVRPHAVRDGPGQQEALQARPTSPTCSTTATMASSARACSTTWPCSAGPLHRTATCSPWTR